MFILNLADPTHVLKMLTFAGASNKVYGCYLVHLLCSPNSTIKIHTTKLVLHYQIYDETFARLGLKIKPPLI